MKPDLTSQAEDIGSAAVYAGSVTEVWDKLDGIDPNDWPEWAEEIYRLVNDACQNLMLAKERIEEFASDEENGTMTFDMDGAHDIPQEDDDD